MFSRRSRLALFAATAVAAVPGAASAQQIDRIVAFGDSYADDGNLFQLLGINPLTTTIYTSGRFSGGTNYIDTLAQILGVPIDNFAIGGAKTDNSNTNGPPLGFVTEYNAFLSGGGGIAFPTVSGTFGEGDLLAISIGGNDARQYQQLGGTLAGAPAAATIAAAQAKTGLDLLVNAGAPTISFLAGDTGRLPEIAANPAGAAIRTSFSTTFNSALQQTLAGYAANGVIVHYLDLGLVLDNIAAGPSAYGITNGLVCPAFPNSTCVINASGYLFYGDLLHLTSDGFAVVARYVAAQLAAPLTLQAPSDLGMDVGRQFGRTLTARMDLGAPRDGDMPEGLKLFVVGDSFSRTLDESRGNQPFDSDSVGVTVGADYGFGSGIVGLAGNYSRPKADFGTGSARVRSDSYQIGAYAGAGLGGGFVQAYLGYGWDKHDIDRRGVVENMSASPDGDHWIAGAKAGYLMLLGNVRVGPVAALDYARVRVDGYTESGDNALTLNVGSAKFKSLRGSIGAEMRGDFAGGGVQLRPYGSLVLEKELSGGNRSISFSQTSSPVIVNHFNFEDVSSKVYGRFTGGASARIFNGVTLDAGVSLTGGKDQGNESSGHVGLKLTL